MLAKKILKETEKIESDTTLSREQVQAAKLANKRTKLLDGIKSEYPYLWALADEGQINLESVATKLSGLGLGAAALYKMGGSALLGRLGLSYLQRTQAGKELVNFIKRKPKLFSIPRTHKTNRQQRHKR